MRRMNQDTVRLLVADLASKVPSDFTLIVGFDALVEIASELSNKMTERQAAQLIGAIAIVAKYAAHEEFAGTSISISRDTRQ